MEENRGEKQLGIHEQGREREGKEGWEERGERGMRERRGEETQT